MNVARSGWAAPVSSVARDLRTAAVPSHFQASRNRVSARGRTGATSGAFVQALPPSVDTATLRIVPLPDHASPEIWWSPAPGSVIPCDGRVMTDFTSIGYVNMSDLPSACRSVYRDVSSLVMIGAETTLSRRSHFTLMLPSHPGRNRRTG